MEKHLLISIFFTQFLPILSFFLSNDKQLYLVPSVAFRYHSNASNAQPTDDWILYAQGKFFQLFLRMKYFNFPLGWYFEHNLVRAKLARTALSTVVNEVNRKRVAYFTGSGKKHKTLCLEGLTSEMCVKTDAHGLLKKQFRLSNDDVQHLRIPGGKVEYFVSTNDGNLRSKGEIFLCDDNGISIISDIVNKSISFCQ